jgi:ABC-type nitrate/sulfonate/bicarbonate transport system ATPase subunit
MRAETTRQATPDSAPDDPAGHTVRAEHIRVTFGHGPGTEMLAVDDVSLHVEAGEFVSLVGPSGCGKSTLFSVIAGLIQPGEGRVEIGGMDTTGLAGAVGYMLQKDLLLPWRTVQDNVCLGLELGGVKKADARSQARPVLERCGLRGFESRHPDQLSGGMRQRAALARTLLYGRPVMLLDEPFGALDAQTRSGLHDWLEDLGRDLGLTVLLITHDVEEALRLSDRAYVMSHRPGRILREVAIDLPRPRGLRCVTTPRFAELKAELLGLLGGGHGTDDTEVVRS